MGWCFLFLDSKEKDRCGVPSAGFERKTKCGGCSLIQKGKATGIVFLVLDSKGTRTKVWSFDSGFENVLSV